MAEINNAGDGTGTGGEGGAGGGGVGEGGKDDSKIFTQAQVNAFIAQNKRELREQLAATAAELTKLQQSSTASLEEKATLAGKLEEMNNQLLSKDELAKKEREKLAKTKDEEISKIAKERDTWQSRFRKSTIENAIIGAATNAFNPKQVLAVLESQAKLTPVEEDGQETGAFQVLIDLTTTDNEGKTKKLTLSPADAIKTMAESPDYFNLFKDPATGGLGRNNQTKTTKGMTAERLAKENPTLYLKKRAEGKVNLQTNEVDMG